MFILSNTHWSAPKCTTTQKVRMIPESDIGGLPDKSELIELVYSTLEASGNAGGIIAVPVLFFPIKKTYWAKINDWAKRSEETALAIFRALGMHADRTTMNLEGYPGLLRELLYPPPWCEYDDVMEPLTEERANKLRSLFIQVKENGIEAVLSTYRDHLVENIAQQEKIIGHSVTEFQKNTIDPRVDFFARKLELADCINEEEFDKIMAAVFDFDELEISGGAPDLLVWDNSHSMWFFAEVKGPGDSIRDSQKNWIRANWQGIKGRMLFISLDTTD